MKKITEIQISAQRLAAVSLFLLALACAAGVYALAVGTENQTLKKQLQDAKRDVLGFAEYSKVPDTDLKIGAVRVRTDAAVLYQAALTCGECTYCVENTGADNSDFSSEYGLYQSYIVAQATVFQDKYFGESQSCILLFRYGKKGVSLADCLEGADAQELSLKLDREGTLNLLTDRDADGFADFTADVGGQEVVVSIRSGRFSLKGGSKTSKVAHNRKIALKEIKAGSSRMRFPVFTFTGYETERKEIIKSHSEAISKIENGSLGTPQSLQIAVSKFDVDRDGIQETVSILFHQAFSGANANGLVEIYKGGEDNFSIYGDFSMPINITLTEDGHQSDFGFLKGTKRECVDYCKKSMVMGLGQRQISPDGDSFEGANRKIGHGSNRS